MDSWKRGRFIHDKYKLEKTNGNPLDPGAKYFVLRYDCDPNAVRALMTYIESIMGTNLDFALDLVEVIRFKKNDNSRFEWRKLVDLPGLRYFDQQRFTRLSSALEIKKKNRQKILNRKKIDNEK